MPVHVSEVRDTGRVPGSAPGVVTPRRVGVEEELLLGDAVTGDLRPAGPQIISACELPVGAVPGALIKREFFLSQLEIATLPHVDIADIRREMVEARARIADAGSSLGVAPMAVPGPILASPTSPFDAISPDARYADIERHYGDVARQSLMCALHVHVEVADDEEGVAAIDRVRPWIPVLIAIGANSPYWRGGDTGYDSWRSRVWNMWPTSGPAELFGNAEGYHTVVQDMVDRGAALDAGLVNLDVRLSSRYPTVEFRVADVCTDLDDAVLIAALARALVSHCADQWRSGAPSAAWRVDELRAAAWRAARFGLTSSLVSPVTRQLIDAVDVLQQLVALLADPLEQTGDLARVTAGVAALGVRGNGASRQRAVFDTHGDIAAVLADIRTRTTTHA